MNLAMAGLLTDICYYWQLLQGQSALFFRPVKLKNFIPEDEEMAFLLSELPGIMRFAESYGLATRGAYETILSDKQPVLWVVSASYSDAIKPYQWRYPFLGKLGYRGYFNKKLAEFEQKRLKEKGFHVRMRPVYAWSSLGFFREPLTYDMMENGPGAFAETVFHELFHRYLYLPGRDELNENLATHVGIRMAEEWLVSRFGMDSEYLDDYRNRQEDDVFFLRFMEQTAMELEEMLETSDGALPVNKFLEIRTRARALKFGNPDKGRKIWMWRVPNLADFVIGNQYYKWNKLLKDELEQLYNDDLILQMQAWKTGRLPELSAEEI